MKDIFPQTTCEKITNHRRTIIGAYISEIQEKAVYTKSDAMKSVADARVTEPRTFSITFIPERWVSTRDNKPDLPTIMYDQLRPLIHMISDIWYDEVLPTDTLSEVGEDIFTSHELSTILDSNIASITPEEEEYILTFENDELDHVFQFSTIHDAFSIVLSNFPNLQHVDEVIS